MTADEITEFGRYVILNRIAVGGTATVFRAKMSGEGATADTERLVALKVFHPDQGEANFLRSFKNEIKILLGLTHPNIPRLYEFGEENGKPFMVLEYVDGKTLRQICLKLADMKMSFPIDLAAYIGCESAKALDFAHNFRDPISNEPMVFVHRDISPQNILVSFDGNVKVIDFGIAKIINEVTSTREGLVKGKPSYLSPEQLNGEELDGRSDVFSLCVVLWELLTGRKLFIGDHPNVVFKKILECDQIEPPSKHNRAVPDELDKIILKGLACDRKKRQKTAGELQRELHRFIYSFMPEFNPQDMSGFTRRIFKDEIALDNLSLREASRLAPARRMKKNLDEDRLLQQKIRERASGARELAPGQASELGGGIVESSGPKEYRGRRGAGAVTYHSLDVDAGAAALKAKRPIRPMPEEKPRSPIVVLIQAAVVLATVGFLAPKFGYHVPFLSDLFYDSPKQVSAPPTQAEEVVKLIDVPPEEIKKTLELREKTQKFSR